MSDEALKKAIAEQHGLPEELGADQVADALEGAAAAIRNEHPHEQFLLDMLGANRDKHPEITRHLKGRET